ncbi:MAG: DUF1592 domain-containing protein [Deltaproteobacteria bacterium]|nr:DUF1592 domain-containing protein [Deltaproteobacteria bacterium]
MKQSVVEVRKFSWHRMFGLVAVGATLMGGCVGSAGPSSNSDNGGEGGGDGGSTGEGGKPPDVVDDTGKVIGTPPSFSCDKDAVPDAVGLRKLTATQYKNTVRDLMAKALGDDAEAMKVWSAVSTAVAKFPAEERERNSQDLHGSYRQLDQDLQQSHVDVTYDVATQIGAQLSQSARLAKLAGACATDANAANDATCITDFVKKFGERALRRPLESGEVDFYKGFYGTSTGIDPAGFADIIAGFLTAPQFLYMVEHGDKAVANKANLYQLSPFELASRLSYHFLQSMPDDELWESAKSGALSDSVEYEKQVDRLMGDARTRKSSQEFFTDYLKVEDLPAMDALNERKDFKALAGDLAVTNMLKTNMINDAVDMFQYYTWEKPAGVKELLTSELSFAKTADMAKIYGVSAWNGQGNPPSLPAGERPGFLTRAAFLATGLVNTRPVMKGVYIRNSVLCDTIPPPPPGAGNTPVDTTNRTTRQAVELITQQDGTTCKGCHESLINGLGFATEDFDALGRHRSQEVQFDSTGKELRRLDINTKAIPRVFDSDEREVSGARELMDRIVESGKAQACLARNYFRYTFARWEDTKNDTDNCALERLRTSLNGNGSLKDMFRTVALAPEFKQRKIAQ